MAYSRRGLRICALWNLATPTLVVAAVAVLLTARLQLLGTLADVGREEERAVALRLSVEARLVSMLNQEVGLRGFLASGDESFLAPYERGRRDEERLRAQLDAEVAPADREELYHALELEARVAERWRQEVAEPQIAARRRSDGLDVPAALRVGQLRFDDYRAAHGSLRDALERVQAAARRHRAELSRANLVAVALVVLLLLVEGAVSRALVRRTIASLVALSNAAERGHVSADTVRGTWLREVLVLAEMLEKLFRAAQERALRDCLTRVYNRSFLTDWLPRQLRLARRTGAPLSVLMIDIDHFKRINDSRGHAAGDQVLVAVARCIEQQLRRSDVVVRYGGEEFTVLLPDTPVAGAFVTGERIRAAIATMTEREGLPTGVRVTVSIGLASAARDAGVHLLPRADAALYDAKRGGRNRVVAAPPPVPGAERLAS